MVSTSEKFEKQLNNSGRIPCFEIKGEVWDVGVNQNYVYANNGGCITVRVRIDPIFSLDEHLQELYAKVLKQAKGGSFLDYLNEELSGSGFDCDWEQESEYVYTTSWHFMDEYGSYDGYIDLKFTLDPEDELDFKLEAVFEDKHCGLQEYIEDAFYERLREWVKLSK